MTQKATPQILVGNQNIASSVASFISVAQNAPKPISDEMVRLIQNRAVGIDLPDVFGGIQNVNAIGYESLLPALVKTTVSTEHPKIRIGGPQCRQPYEASFLNASALSFGPMGKTFIMALNKAACQGSFYQNTGEAGLSPYHLGMDVDVESGDFDSETFFKQLADTSSKDTFQAVGDLVWQIGTNYFGCRKPDNSFDPVQFQLKANLAPVKMIEIKLSQGVEPWAKMPVKEVTPGIAKLLGIELGKQAILKAQHLEFNSPVGLLKFVDRLRTLSGGKPIGIKLGISHRHYFLAICKAMRTTGILLDFVTIDGMEAGTTAAQGESLGFTGTALHDALVFVNNVLVGMSFRPYIRVIASGRVFTEQDIICTLVRGADLCATARGMMLAVGCDQQLKCYQGVCSQGIATQDPYLLKNFNMLQNVERLRQYHNLTIQGLNGLVAMAGLNHPSQLKPFHMQKRINYAEVVPLDEVYEFLKEGVLLTRLPWRFPKRYKRSWRLAHPEVPFTEALPTG
jgi:glutamate synthase domain-containing protein 2